MSFQVYYLGVKTFPIKRRRNVEKKKRLFSQKKKKVFIFN